MLTHLKPLAMALSALSFGVLGWAAAHISIDVLLAHEHHGVRHVHGFLPSMLTAAGSLATASLVMLFTTGLVGKSAPVGAAAKRADIRTAVGMSAAGYVLVELGEHWLIGGRQLPTPMALLVGFAIYVIVGVGASLLWQASVEAIQRAARRLRARRHTRDDGRRPGRASVAMRVPASSHWPYLGAGRSPPAFSA